MVKREVEIETVGECVDEIDKLAELIGEMQLKQEDRSCVHASNELHLHVFHVVAGLAFQKQKTSVHISSGLALQRHMASSDNTSGPVPQRKESSGPRLQPLTPGYISSELVQNPVSPAPYVPPSKKDYEILFQPLFDEYFNPPPHTVSLDLVAVVHQELIDQPNSTSTSLYKGVEENKFIGHQNAQLIRHPL
ncbi:hypothetical protein Tco_0994125 [Tanacetum coccineum]